jgi:hypothetical protein
MRKHLLLAAFVAYSFGAAAQCNPPTNLSIGNVTSASASVAFSVPTPAPGSFNVVYQAAGGAAQTVIPAPSGSPVALTNLLPSTVYTVTVTSNCTGSTSTPISANFTTGAAPTCPAVTNIMATNTSTTVTVTATPAPGATGYFIDCATTGGVLVGSTASASPQYTFTGLTPNLLYQVCISSICPAGGSPPSACAFAATVTAARPAELAAAVSLAPNPASQRAVLSLPAEWNRQPLEVTISDVCHAVRQSSLPAASRVELDLTGLAPGLYAVQVRTPLGTAVKRLLVE